MIGVLTQPGTADVLYSFEDGTTEGWTATIIESDFDDRNSQLAIVPGPGNTDGQNALQVIGRAGGYVRNVTVILDQERIEALNQAIADGWNIAFDWTIVAEENPGSGGYLAQLSIGSSAGWTQLDMNTANGFPVWDPAGPAVQTMSPSIPLSGFGSGTLGYNGVPLDSNGTGYFMNVALSGAGEVNEQRTYYLDNFRLMAPTPGDFNNNGVLDAADIDDLTRQSAAGADPEAFDLNGDAVVNRDDVNVWVKDLFHGWIGDANLDGEFNSGDLVAVLTSGTYEANIDSVWSTGDFNGDGRTNSGDLVAALTDGGYELGPRAAVAAVPEPHAFALMIFGTFAGFVSCRMRRMVK
jgi:hypothetical protein